MFNSKHPHQYLEADGIHPHQYLEANEIPAWFFRDLLLGFVA